MVGSIITVLIMIILLSIWLGLTVAAVRDIDKQPFFTFGNKTFWYFIVIFVGIAGSNVYFITQSDKRGGV